MFEKYRIQTYKQASHKPYVIAAMILMSQVEDLPQRLKALANS